MLAALCVEVSMAALVGPLVGPPAPKPGRRAALGSAAASLSLTLALGRPPLAAHAAAPIEKGAPAFGTSESRTGLLDGIKSAFSEKTGEQLAAEYARSPADISGVTAALPPAFAKVRPPCACSTEHLPPATCHLPPST